MANRIRHRLDAGSDPWIVPYLTAGFPRIEETVNLLRALEEGGADAIEIGLPFSDPLADGPVIQKASTVALQGGIRHEAALEVAREFRSGSELPLIFMGYLNPILAYGKERFLERAAGAGVDGLIVPDLPLEEAEILRPAWVRAGLSWIGLVAPTSSRERIEAIDRLSTDLNYCVSVTGVTGARTDLPPDLTDYLERCRECMARPFVVGFGVSRAEQVRGLVPPARGVVVGSALLAAVGEAATPGDRIRVARDFVRGLRP